MKNKKFLALLVVAILVICLAFTGCDKKETKSENNAKPKLKVALVLSGLLGDNSFNDLCYMGLQQAEKDFGIEFKVLEDKDPSNWETNLISMADAGYDLVICSSTQLMDALQKNAKLFKNTKFGIIDGIVDQPNVVSAVFAQNQSSFLVGAAAAMYTKMSNLPGVNSDKVIGAIGGMDIPVINDFVVGYTEGAHYIDPNVKVLVSYAGSFNDPLKGKELSLAQYSQGSDIIFNIAAGTGSGILEAASNTGKYAIGCDVDQDNTYPGNVLISEIKHVNKATYMMVEQIVNGTWKGGETLRLDVNNDGIGASDMSVLKGVLKDKFPEEIPQKLKEITQKMKDGKIVVSHGDGFDF